MPWVRCRGNVRGAYETSSCLGVTLHWGVRAIGKFRREGNAIFEALEISLKGGEQGPRDLGGGSGWEVPDSSGSFPGDVRQPLGWSRAHCRAVSGSLAGTC